MSKKEKFIEEINRLISEGLVLTEDAKNYFDALCVNVDNSKPQFTENGRMILQFIQENKDTYNNLFNAKSVGEGLNITSKTASGAMRKLVTDGYLEKVGANPVIYSLTEKGATQDLSVSEE